jgi:1-acyl-sn-glycerol-3-phosphate acyltransferase
VIRSLRYLAALVGATFAGTGRLAWAVLRREAPGEHSTFDRVPRDWSRRLLGASGIEVATRGLERLDGLGACVYAVNHVSFVDIWALEASLPGSLRFVAKEALFRIPVFGTALRISGQIPIDRGDRAQAFDAFAHAAEALRAGRSAIVFPEGTRSVDGRLGPFKKGAFVLAIRTQHPVVPVYVEGTFGLMPKGWIVPRSGRVEVRIGAPIPTLGLGYDDRDALTARCHAAMAALAGHVDAPPGAG